MWTKTPKTYRKRCIFKCIRINVGLASVLLKESFMVSQLESQAIAILIAQEHAHTYPRNCILEGPREIIRDASPSPSTRGGGVVSFCGLTRRQVMRVGAAQVRGGMITRRPLCLLPRMDPPLASTMKLTRNLSNNQPVSKSGTMNFQNSRKPSITLKPLQKSLLLDTR